MADAAAVDAKYAKGETITPLCGLPLAVKDTIDVQGYRTTAATPGLARESVHWHCLMHDFSMRLQLISNDFHEIIDHRT